MKRNKRGRKVYKETYEIRKIEKRKRKKEKKKSKQVNLEKYFAEKYEKVHCTRKCQ